MPTINRLTNKPFTQTSRVDTYVLEAPATGYPIKFKFGNKSKKVEGIAKLSQIFLKKLFTVRGSNPLNLNEGTEFTTLIGSGISDEEEALMVIQEAIKDAERQVNQDQTNQRLPADEVLRSVSMAKFVFLATDRIELFLDLISEAGVQAVVKLPHVDIQG